MISLRELQARFHQRVARPGPVREPCDDLVAPAGTRTPRACLDVYAEMYFCRLHDVLAEQHPALRAVLGERPFRRLVERYLAAHRPTSPSIGDAGARLPGLLDGWHAELARLERLHVELFEAADAPPATLDALAALPPEALATCPLRLVPAHGLLVAGHCIDQVWTDPRVSPEPGTTRLVVWRDDVTVRHRVVDSDGEWLALELASRGFTVAGLETDPRVSFGPAELFAWLRGWCDDGLLAAPGA